MVTDSMEMTLLCNKLVLLTFISFSFSNFDRSCVPNFLLFFQGYMIFNLGINGRIFVTMVTVFKDFSLIFVNFCQKVTLFTVKLTKNAFFGKIHVCDYL